MLSLYAALLLLGLCPAISSIDIQATRTRRMVIGGHVTTARDYPYQASTVVYRNPVEIRRASFICKMVRSRVNAAAALSARDGC